MNACPDAERLAAYLEGRIEADRRAPLEAHFAACPVCAGVLAETLRARRFVDAAQQWRRAIH